MKLKIEKEICQYIGNKLNLFFVKNKENYNFEYIQNAILFEIKFKKEGIKNKKDDLDYFEEQYEFKNIKSYEDFLVQCQKVINNQKASYLKLQKQTIKRFLKNQTFFSKFKSKYFGWIKGVETKKKIEAVWTQAIEEFSYKMLDFYDGNWQERLNEISENHKTNIADYKEKINQLEKELVELEQKVIIVNNIKDNIRKV